MELPIPEEDAIHEETQMNQPDDPESPGKINLPDIDQRNNQGSLFSPNNQKANSMVKL